MSQDGAQDLSQQEIPELRRRMTVIKEATAAEVEAKWVTAHRTPAVFDMKVKARLAAHQEYRSLQERVRVFEATLAAEQGAGSGS